MNTRLAHLALGAAAVSALVVVGVVGKEPTAPRPAEALVSQTSPVAAVGCRFEPGERLGYRVVTTMTIDGRRPQVTTADLVFQVRSSTSQSAVLQGRLGTTALSVRVGPDCRFEAFGFPREVADAARATARSQMLGLEVVLRGGDTQWATRQTDSTGTYDATYRREDGTVVKELRRYRRVSVDGARVTSATGHWTVRPDPQGRWVEGLEGTFMTQLMVTPLSGPVMRPTISGVVSLTRLERVPLANLGLAGPLVWVGPTDSIDVGPPRRDDLDRWASASRADVQAHLSALHAMHGGKNASAKAEVVATWLRGNPAAISELLAALADGSWPSALVPSTFLGLEKTGTAAAHNALATILVDPSRHLGHRLQAAWSMGDLPDATIETVDLLARMGAPTGADPDGLQNSANYALGRIESRLRNAAPEVSKAARAALWERLNGSTNELSLNKALEAVGNSGHPEFLQVASTHLIDTRHAVRAAAIRALRGMPPATSRGVLMDRLKVEQDGATRARIVSALLVQAEPQKSIDAELVTMATGRLPLEASRSARRALIELLGAAARHGNSTAYDALVRHFGAERSQPLLALIGRFVKAKDLM